MKTRPILFSGPMVRAILEGRKTVTRRVLRPDWKPGLERVWLAQVPQRCWEYSPYGQPGDRLWVRETWCSGHGLVETAPGAYFADVVGTAPAAPRTLYRADGAVLPPGTQWRPSIFMKRDRSRLTIAVESVRVERLQDISEEDAKAEGAFFTDYGAHCFHDWKGPGPCPAPQHHQQRPGWSMVPTVSADECLASARMAFANLWIRLNGAEGEKSWDANCWVWVVSFSVLPSRVTEDSEVGT